MVGTRGSHEGAAPGGHRQDFVPVRTQKILVARNSVHDQLLDRSKGFFRRVVGIEVVASLDPGVPGIGLDLERLVPGFGIGESHVPIGTRSDHGDRRYHIEPGRQGNGVEGLRLDNVDELCISNNEFSGLLLILGVADFIVELGNISGLQRTGTTCTRMRPAS